MTTRSTTNVWLVGPRCDELKGAKFPNKREAMAFFFHHHLTEKKTVKESAALTADRVMDFWGKARIPTRLRKHVIDAVVNIFLEWKKLKKNQNNSSKRSATLEEKEKAFSSSLDWLFDIAHMNAMNMMKIEEDKLFLQEQRKKGRPGSMGSVDCNLAKKEARTAERLVQATKRQLADEEEKKKREEQVALVFSSSSSAENSEDELWISTQSQEPSTSVALPQKHPRKQVLDQNTSAALDRTKTSDRNAVYILASTAQSLGHDISPLTLSRSSVHRHRIQHRKNIAAIIKEKFSLTTPLVIHWDGKMMTDITGRDVIDRLPVLVSGGDATQLLRVPKLSSGTGKSMAEAVHEAIEEWSVKDRVVAMCFDMTSSNTGRVNGACTLLEQKMGRELLHLACRHHILEIVLEAAFTSVMGSSTGPEILIFKRFQQIWGSIDQSLPLTAMDKDADPWLQEIADETIKFAMEQLKIQQPRDDYRELLELSIIFLGGVPPHGIHFRAPGGLHRARWMAKAIYSLKLWMFRGQFKLTLQEETSLKAICDFIIKVYLKAWFLAPASYLAPAQDLWLLKELHKYNTIH